MEVDHSQTGSEPTGDGPRDTARVDALVVGGRNPLERGGVSSVFNSEIELPTSKTQRF